MDLLRRLILRERSRREQLVIVLVAVAAAVVVRALLTPVLGASVPWITFLIAVQVVAVLAGGAAAASAVLLSMLAGDLAFVEPRWSLHFANPASVLSLVAFACIASLIGAVGAFMQRAFREAEHRRQRLESEIVQRTAAETSLRNAAEELRHARDAEHDHAAVLSLAHIFTRDPAGTILTWGTGATELYGWSPDEAVGRTARELLDTTYPMPFEDIMAALQREGRWEGELTHTTRDGRRLTVASHWALRRGPNGEAVAIVEVNNDITHQRDAERARHESDERFQLATEAMVGLVYDWDQASGVVRRSRALLDITGFDPAEVPARWDWWVDRVHPDDRGRVVEARERALAAGSTTVSAEYRVQHRGGHYVWVWDHSVVALDEHGQPVRQVGCTVSIDQQKRIEEALRESEARFRAIADSAPVHIWMETELGGAVFKNRTAREYVGPAAAATENWEGVLHPDDVARYLDEYRRARSQRRPLRIEVRVRRHDGEYRWFESIALPRFEGDQLIGYIGCSVDVHERRAAEQALREADQRKDEFLAMLAHELRNPLGPIRNAVAVLRAHGSDDPEMAAARDMIDRQVDHMVRLIDDLLDVSRITRGQVRLHRESCLLGDILEQAIETVQPLIERLEHRLDVAAPAEPVYLDGDATRLVQVVGNLLHNAAKYTPPGGRLSLDVRVEGPQLVIRVVDNGRGIPPEILPHIFDLFVQDISGLDRAQGGLGVGLTVVKRLVELHGGHIHVYSQGEGHGSEFSVRLPIVVTAPSRPPTTVREHSSAIRAAVRILIVEDNRDAADSLALLLRLDGHVVEIAHDAETALGVASTFVPDVALIDIGLPGMSGYALAAALRAEPAWHGVAFIALSGYGQEEDKQRALAAGFSRHFTKPVDVDVLRTAVAAVAASLASAAHPPE